MVGACAGDWFTSPPRENLFIGRAAAHIYLPAVTRRGDGQPLQSPRFAKGPRGTRHGRRVRTWGR